jgi:hypothetical protein
MRSDLPEVGATDRRLGIAQVARSSTGWPNRLARIEITGAPCDFVISRRSR